MWEAIQQAFLNLFTVQALSFLLFGVVIGLVVGFLPGIGGIVGMSLILPFLYGMDPIMAIPLMIGMIAANHTADTFPSILIGVPGSSGSATMMDGFPLSRQGRASEALGAAFFSSMTGGIVGAIVLLGAILVARPLILALGAPELFALTVLGMSVVAVLARGAILVGLAGAALGLLIGAIGSSPATPTFRYTGDIDYLYLGVPLAALTMGLFAVPELVGLLSEGGQISRTGKLEPKGLRRGIREALRHKRLILGSSMVGTVVGIVPGLGGAVVEWLSYGLAKRFSKNTETFGKGDIRGVIAPESANNSKEGGALIPSLLFGIPGSGTTAVLLGGLLLLGIQPGPDMVGKHLDVSLNIIWSLAVGNVLATALCIVLARVVARLTMISARKIVPFLFVFILFAAYQVSNSWGDVIVLIVAGILGIVMKEAGWARPPLLVGFVLSTAAERYLHLSMSRYGPEWLLSPTVIVIFAVTAAFVLTASGLNVFRRRPRQLAEKVVEEATR